MSLTHNLPNGDWLKEGGWFTAPRNVDPDNPEEDPGSSWKVLNSETTPFHGFLVSWDPFLSWGEESHVDLGLLHCFPHCPPQTPSQRGLSEPRHKWQPWSSLPDNSKEDHTHSIVDTVTHISRTRKPGVPAI